MLYTCNNWNIISFNNESKSSEGFYDIQKVVLEININNIYSIVDIVKYVDLSKIDPPTMIYYFITFISNPILLQKFNITNGKVLNSGNIV